MGGGPEKDPEPQQQRTMPQDHAGQLLGQGGEGGRGEALPLGGLRPQKVAPATLCREMPPVITEGTSRQRVAGAQKDADQVRKAKPLHMGDKWVTKLQAEPEKKKTVTREWRVTV